MKLSKRIRKDCLGCKCFDSFGCQLGYETKVVDLVPNSVKWGGLTKRVPLENCPKPLTNKDLILAQKTMQKHQQL